MTDVLTAAIMVALGLTLGVAIPWAAVRMSVGQLAESPAARTVNFRGETVFNGLGIAWLVWSGTAIVAGVLASALARGSMLAVLTLAGPLALVAYTLGLLDDTYGSGSARGFRGHLGAMLSGRLTTGGLKLLGIGAASLVVAFVVARIAPWGHVPVDALLVGKVVVAGAAIALTSNFVNLTDLRPGRALKVYVVLALCGVASAWAGLQSFFESSARVDSVVGALALAVFLLGPVLAVWAYDLNEIGMLGDAGANPMGAVAGMLIVMGLPTWGLVAFAVAVLALNLASERFSFTQVIESTAVLRWLDGLGRPEEPAGTGSRAQ